MTTTETLIETLAAEHPRADRATLARLARWATETHPDAVRGVVLDAIARAEYPEEDAREALRRAAGSMILPTPEDAAMAVLRVAQLDSRWAGESTLDLWAERICR